jgi:RND family efflux transporter MFP subunit
MNDKRKSPGPVRILIIATIVAAVAALFWFSQHKTDVGKEKGRPDFMTKVPVSVAVATKAAVRDSFAVVGISDAWRDVDILSETSGIVRVVSSEVGQKMTAGETLLKIDDEVAASGLRKATVNRQLAKRDFERYRNLQQEGAVAVSSYEAMKLKLEDAEADLVAARRRFRDTAIKAPIAGTVTLRTVEVGDLVQPGMKVANMVDLSKIRIRSAVPEKQVSRLSEGMPVQVTTDVWPGRVFRASITTISAKSMRGHTYEVESIMDNPKETPFRAGMFARTAFVGGEAHDAVLIPRQALVGSVRNPEVFVVIRGLAHLRKLAVGAESGDRLEVLQGLGPGEVVVVSGQNELDEGSPVSVVRQENGR